MDVSGSNLPNCERVTYALLRLCFSRSNCVFYRPGAINVSLSSNGFDIVAAPSPFTFDAVIDSSALAPFGGTIVFLALRFSMFGLDSGSEFNDLMFSGVIASLSLVLKSQTG